MEYDGTVQQTALELQFYDEESDPSESDGELNFYGGVFLPQDTTTERLSRPSMRRGIAYSPTHPVACYKSLAEDLIHIRRDLSNGSEPDRYKHTPESVRTTKPIQAVRFESIG